jgi:hypothetical protein
MRSRTTCGHARDRREVVLDVVVRWFATKQLAFAGVADIFGAEHGYAGDDGGHSRGNEPGRASHAELLAASLVDCAWGESVTLTLRPSSAEQ